MKINETLAQPRILVFSGFNQRAIIAFFRTLEATKINYGIIALTRNDAIFKTSFGDRVVAVRDSKEISIENIENAINAATSKLKAKKFLIAPSTESLNRFFLDNPALLARHNCYIPLVDKSTYELVSDKHSFAKLCEQEGISTPEKLDLSKANVPCVAKPYAYLGRDKIAHTPLIISSKEDLESFRRCHYVQDFFIQEYVQGRCLYLLFYFYGDGSHSVAAQENLLQQEDGKSMLVAKSFPTESMSSLTKYVSLFNRLSYRGLVMIELKVGDDGKEIMIEANPRFWGPSQLFVDSNTNLFLDLLYDYGFLKQKPEHSPQHPTFYFWDDGVSENYHSRPSLAFHNYSAKEFLLDLPSLKKTEIYSRQDTTQLSRDEHMTDKDKLIELYEENSKHSNYQILAPELRSLIGENELNTTSRFELERFEYITKKIDFNNQTVTDIGGNTGYFSFESLAQGASSVSYYEGNQKHSEFVGLAAKVVNRSGQFNIKNEYYEFEKASKEKTNVTLLLNVLHHVGDDYGDQSLSIENAKNRIRESLQLMANQCDTMVFQLGFNWKGDRSQCLFEHGTKEELVNFMKKSIEGAFVIEAIGVAVPNEGGIEYQELNESNIKRFDSLGEFLNRPLFVLKSLR